MKNSKPVVNAGSSNGPSARTRVGALDRVLQVLDQLRDRGEPMTAYEIATTSNAPLSTIYGIVEDMVAKRLLDRRDHGAVWLGPRLFEYGLLYANSLDHMSVAAEEMQRLCAEVGETVQICGLDQGMMIVLQMLEGNGHFRVTSRIGSRVPVNWTASGRLLAGHLGTEERVRFFQQFSQPSPTGRAETSPARLAELSGRAFAERLSVQIGESDLSVACIASPVIDLSKKCVFTMSIVLPETKVKERPDFYAKAVMASAKRIEYRLGWRAHDLLDPVSIEG